MAKSMSMASVWKKAIFDKSSLTQKETSMISSIKNRFLLSINSQPLRDRVELECDIRDERVPVMVRYFKDFEGVDVVFESIRGQYTAIVTLL